MGRVKRKPVLALLCIVLSILTIVAMMPGMAYADEKTDGNAGNLSEKIENTAGGSSTSISNLSPSITSTNLEQNTGQEDTGTGSDETTQTLPTFDTVVDSDLSVTSYTDSDGTVYPVTEDQTEHSKIATAYPGKSFNVQEKIDCSLVDAYNDANTIKLYLMGASLEGVEEDEYGSVLQSKEGKLSLQLSVPENVTLNTEEIRSDNEFVHVDMQNIKIDEYKEQNIKVYSIPLIINTDQYSIYNLKQIGIISINLPMSLSQETDYGTKSTITSTINGTITYYQQAPSLDGQTEKAAIPYSLTDRQSKGGFYGDSTDYISKIDGDSSNVYHQVQDEQEVSDGHYYAAYVSTLMQTEMAYAKALQNELMKSSDKSLLTEYMMNQALSNNMLDKVSDLINRTNSSFNDNWDGGVKPTSKDNLVDYFFNIINSVKSHPDYIKVNRCLPDGTDYFAKSDDTTTQLTIGTPYRVTLHANVKDKSIKDPWKVEYVKQSDGVLNKSQISIKKLESLMPDYQFKYWTKDNGTDDYFSGKDSQEVTGNIDLYAKWDKKITPTTPTEPTTPTTPTTPTEPSKPEEHTITFQPNNGQPAFTQTVPDGGQAVLPDEPSKKGHEFIGWYTDSALTKAYDFSTPVKSDLTLYAKWEKGKPTPNPAKKKVTGILLPKVIAKGKHTQVLTWTALKNVDGYFIYTNHCDEGRLLHPFKKVADYKASKARVYTKKHLTTYDNYKYYVAAYKIKHGKKVIVRNSVTVHSVCGNTSARSTNVKAVKASRHAVTLKKGKTYRIKASAYKVNKKRAFLDQTHCGLLRYLTADSKIASVDYNTGKVKAVKAGKTNIYVLGVNGIRDKVTVTVK